MGILKMSVAFENGLPDKSDTSIAKLSIQTTLTLGPDDLRGFSKSVHILTSQKVKAF